MTVKAVWHIVKESAKRTGVAKLAPHDLRRTCARLCHASGASWSRSNSSWGTSQFKRPNDILAASNGFDQPSMTISVSSRILEIAEGLPTTRELTQYPKP
jgi:hypothetical protein